MPILSGVSFGVTIPYTSNSVKRTRRPDYSAQQSYRSPSRLTSFSDISTKRGTYKYNRASRLMNQYKMYNKRVDTPTIGTIISLEF